jgi:hypothetical protein
MSANSMNAASIRTPFNKRETRNTDRRIFNEGTGKWMRISVDAAEQARVLAWLRGVETAMAAS